LQHGAISASWKPQRSASSGSNGDVLDHVVAAGDVGHDHRRDPGDEDPIQPAPLGGGLDRLEHGLDHALAADQLLVAVLARSRLASTSLAKLSYSSISR
jgi:hypothetical protein